MPLTAAVPDWLTALQPFAWPLVVLIAIFCFGRPLASLLSSVSKIRFREFELETKSVLADITTKDSGSSPSPTTFVLLPSEESLLAFTKRHPYRAVFKSWELFATSWDEIAEIVYPKGKNRAERWSATFYWMAEGGFAQMDFLAGLLQADAKLEVMELAFRPWAWLLDFYFRMHPEIRRTAYANTETAIAMSRDLREAIPKIKELPQLPLVPPSERGPMLNIVLGQGVQVQEIQIKAKRASEQPADSDAQKPSDG